MVFMSQSGLTDPSRENAWAVCYADHLGIMVTVPGVASAAVFDDPYYRSIRGMGEWQPLIDTIRAAPSGTSGGPPSPDRIPSPRADLAHGGRSRPLDTVSRHRGRRHGDRRRARVSRRRRLSDEWTTRQRTMSEVN
jgi:hypothetical protein